MRLYTGLGRGFSLFIFLAFSSIRLHAYGGTPDYEVYSFLTMLVSLPATLIFLLLYLASRFRWLVWAVVVCALTSVVAFLIFHADRVLTTAVAILTIALIACFLNWRRNRTETKKWQQQMDAEERERILQKPEDQH